MHTLGTHGFDLQRTHPWRVLCVATDTHNRSQGECPCPLQMALCSSVWPILCSLLCFKVLNIRPAIFDHSIDYFTPSLMQRWGPPFIWSSSISFLFLAPVFHSSSLSSLSYQTVTLLLFFISLIFSCLICFWDKVLLCYLRCLKFAILLPSPSESRDKRHVTPR